MASVITHSDEETKRVGFELGEKLPAGSVVCFFGHLAAGKTTFIKGFVEGASGFSSEEVNSPTFVYLNIYEGSKRIYHFDLYRLEDSNQFLAMGFDEYLFGDGISCIEWSEKIEPLIPSNALRIEMSHLGENQRKIVIHGKVPV